MGSFDDRRVEVVDLMEYAFWVMWKDDGECRIGSNGALDNEGFILNLRVLADELERRERDKEA